MWLHCFCQQTKNKLLLVERRRQDKRTPWISLERYVESPFIFLFKSGNDQGLLNCCAVDHRVFQNLLHLFEPVYNCYTVNKNTGQDQHSILWCAWYFLPVKPHQAYIVIASWNLQPVENVVFPLQGWYISLSSRPSISMSGFNNFPLFHTNRKDVLENIKQVERLSLGVVLLPFRATTGICSLWRLLLCRLFCCLRLCFRNFWSNHLLLFVSDINDRWKAPLTPQTPCLRKSATKKRGRRRPWVDSREVTILSAAWWN